MNHCRPVAARLDAEEVARWLCGPLEGGQLPHPSGLLLSQSLALEGKGNAFVHNVHDHLRLLARGTPQHPQTGIADTRD